MSKPAYMIYLYSSLDQYGAPTAEPARWHRWAMSGAEWMLEQINGDETIARRAMCQLMAFTLGQTFAVSDMAVVQPPDPEDVAGLLRGYGQRDVANAPHDKPRVVFPLQLESACGFRLVVPKRGIPYVRIYEWTNQTVKLE